MIIKKKSINFFCLLWVRIEFKKKIVSYFRFNLISLCDAELSKPQLSIEACPKTWLPKTLTSLQLNPNITQLSPAMVAYCHSNLVHNTSKFGFFVVPSIEYVIQKLDIALSWAELILNLSFPTAKRNDTVSWNLMILYSWQ